MNDLLKKANYNTKVFEIDTTLSSLDGKITKNKNKFNGITNDTILFFWEICYLIMKMVFKLI